MEVYFKYLKKFEFTKSRESLQAIQQEGLKKELLDLILVVENEGQKYKYQDFLSKKGEQPISELLKCIILLKESNAAIVYNKITENTFKNLTQALEIADIEGMISLKRQILLTILQLYRKDVIQINRGYEYFLDQYLSLAVDPEDFGYYAMTNFIFQSKSDDPIDDKFHRSAYLMDSIFSQIEESSRLFPLYLFEKGIYYEIIGKNAEANLIYDSLLLITPDEPYYRYINFGTYLKLSEIAANRNDYSSAISLLEKTKKYPDTSQPFISEYYYYSYGSRYLDESGLHKKALDYLKKANSLEIEINKVNILNKRSQALVAYQTLEKEKQILEQEKQLLIEREQKSRTRNVALILGITLVLGLVISALSYRNAKRKQQIAIQEKNIQQQKVTNLLKEQELTTIDAMITGQEKERQRIANDLHDDLGGLMATIRLHFDSLRGKSLEDPNSLFDKTNGLINEAYEKIRAIAHAKNSGVIAKEGLLQSVMQMANKISIANNLEIIVNDHGLDTRLENSLELSLFRIIQELVTNVVKHANATQAHIHLTNHYDSLNIMIEDNGVGFNTSGITKQTEGMGLKNVDKRVEFLNGSMEIDSEFGRGTNIIINIPL